MNGTSSRKQSGNRDESAGDSDSGAGRTAKFSRKTNETKLDIELNLDGSGEFTCDLNIPFFEHMLNLFARHALMDLKVTGRGDVEIDGHHTVEDTGIVLGQALKQALGEKSGIERYGHAYVPMEESLGRCVIDLCNRPFLSFVADIPKAKVGEFDAELAEEFFRAFAMNLGATMHLELLTTGGNVHHQLESLFKATGLAFGRAAARNPRIRGVLSTKGAL